MSWNLTETEQRELHILSAACGVSQTEMLRILIRAAVADLPEVREVIVNDFRERVKNAASQVTT
jgi:hypothetical protein